MILSRHNDNYLEIVPTLIFSSYSIQMALGADSVLVIVPLLKYGLPL